MNEKEKKLKFFSELMDTVKKWVFKIDKHLPKKSTIKTEPKKNKESFKKTLSKMENEFYFIFKDIVESEDKVEKNTEKASLDDIKGITTYFKDYIIEKLIEPQDQNDTLQSLSKIEDAEKYSTAMEDQKLDQVKTINSLKEKYNQSLKIFDNEKSQIQNSINDLRTKNTELEIKIQRIENNKDTTNTTKNNSDLVDKNNGSLITSNKDAISKSLKEIEPLPEIVTRIIESFKKSFNEIKQRIKTKKMGSKEFNVKNQESITWNENENLKSFFDNLEKYKGMNRFKSKENRRIEKELRKFLDSKIKNFKEKNEFFKTYNDAEIKDILLKPDAGSHENNENLIQEIKKIKNEIKLEIIKQFNKKTILSHGKNNKNLSYLYSLFALYFTKEENEKQQQENNKNKLENLNKEFTKKFQYFFGKIDEETKSIEEKIIRLEKEQKLELEKLNNENYTLKNKQTMLINKQKELLNNYYNDKKEKTNEKETKEEDLKKENSITEKTNDEWVEMDKEIKTLKKNLSLAKKNEHEVAYKTAFNHIKETLSNKLSNEWERSEFNKQHYKNDIELYKILNRDGLFKGRFLSIKNQIQATIYKKDFLEKNKGENLEKIFHFLEKNKNIKYLDKVFIDYVSDMEKELPLRQNRLKIENDIKKAENTLNRAKLKVKKMELDNLKQLKKAEELKYQEIEQKYEHDLSKEPEPKPVKKTQLKQDENPNNEESNKKLKTLFKRKWLEFSKKGSEYNKVLSTLTTLSKGFKEIEEKTNEVTETIKKINNQIKATIENINTIKNKIKENKKQIKNIDTKIKENEKQLTQCEEIIKKKLVPTKDKTVGTKITISQEELLSYQDEPTKLIIDVDHENNPDNTINTSPKTKEGP